MPARKPNFRVPCGSSQLLLQVMSSMARTQEMYIELKTGYQHKGPAWIGRVKFSHSGKTVYFNGRALSRTGGQGVQGNHSDFETGEEYWVSGVTKDGSDRHWAGSGKIKIEADAVSEYLAIVGAAQLDASRFEVCTDFVETDIKRFHEIEKRKLD